MGRCVKGYEQGAPRAEPYIPAAFGNRADKDPIKVWINSPTEHDLRAIYSAPASKMKVTQEAGKAASVEMSGEFLFGWQEVACARQIYKIENYEVRGRQILTGDDLARFGETELVTECATEVTIEASLDEEEKKTSGEPSGSSPPATPASTGTVVTAENKTSATSEGADPGNQARASTTSSSELVDSTDVRKPG